VRDVILTFWLSVAFVTYVYVGYPLLLFVWSRVRGRHGGLRRADCGLPSTIDRLKTQSAIRTPQSGVSIVIAARNEGARLAARIDNLLTLEFPASRRQIIVVSDGSTDDTLDVLARFSGTVEAVCVPAGGKAQALNAGVACARFDIVVFADARQTFAPDALTALLEPFADPAVGCVTGELVLDAESELFENRRRAGAERRKSEAATQPPAVERRGRERRRAASSITDGVGMYWRYEKHLRRLESAIGSTVGATGAIYAIRRELWRALPPDTILDDVLTPLRVVLAGYRVVFNERALAFDRVTMDAQSETRRKIRTLAGNYQLAMLEPRILLPWRNPVWLQFVSHKLGRLAVPYALLAMFAASVVLAETGVVYRLALAAQVGLYLLAGCGALIEARVQPPAGSGRGIGAEPATVREVA
jgi:poly-beta-1,6-N-acetyl-D-glucosamine synthase